MCQSSPYHSWPQSSQCRCPSPASSLVALSDSKPSALTAARRKQLFARARQQAAVPLPVPSRGAAEVSKPLLICRTVLHRIGGACGCQSLLSMSLMLSGACSEQAGLVPGCGFLGTPLQVQSAPWMRCHLGAPRFQPPPPWGPCRAAVSEWLFGEKKNHSINQSREREQSWVI